MDIFIEKLVAKKRDGKDIAFIVGMILLTLLLSFVVLMFFGILFGFEFAIIIGLFFGCFWLISTRNIEFEYSLTNNEMDIDKIINRRRRKRIVTVNARKMDMLAPTTSPEYQRESNSATIARTYNCASGNPGSRTYFATFYDRDGLKCLLLFEPNEKMIDGFRRYARNKVIDS